MKKFLKVIGVLFAVAFVGFGVWYWQALQIAGDPLLTSCRAVDIYDDVSGEKIVGVEDMDFDPVTGTIFMSAYDRRAVAREIEGGNVTTQGGIYTIRATVLNKSEGLKVHDISRQFKRNNKFLPHGFAFNHETRKTVFAINRIYNQKGDDLALETSIYDFWFIENYLSPNFAFSSDNVCNANDVTFVDEHKMLVSVSKSGCRVTRSLIEMRLKAEGSISLLDKKTHQKKREGLNFPNGITTTDSFVMAALTRDYTILRLDPENFETEKKVKLPIAPDNLTVDEADNLYVAGFPNLIDYYFYMQGWMGVKKSPSAVYRIEPETHEQTLLYKDDGSMISGATVALRAGDYLVMGSAWDDNIAICEGINGLD